jgi:large subunit ribosomal protein L9
VKVILIENVENLGAMGKEVDVTDGYARNYLLPRKLAVAATSAALCLIEKKKKERAKLEEKEKQAVQQLVDKLKGASCTIKMEAGEGDKLFGSVTTEMISEHLRAEGIEIDKKKIILGEPIKALGVFNVDLKLHTEVKAQLRVWVVKK